MGINLERMGTKEETLWNQHTEPTSSEKQFTKKWLKIIENNLIEKVSQKREISKERVADLGKVLLSPKQALETKLVDEITTMEEYK